MALWCSAKAQPLKLREGKFYRLDYFELDPRLRGGEAGVLAFALVAARARDVGADGIVLATWPPLRRFYEGIGGVERELVGWRAPANLITFVFTTDALANLSAVLSERQESSG
jgi:hypothetical protein